MNYVLWTNLTRAFGSCELTRVLSIFVILQMNLWESHCCLDGSYGFIYTAGIYGAYDVKGTALWRHEIPLVAWRHSQFSLTISNVGIVSLASTFWFSLFCSFGVYFRFIHVEQTIPWYDLLNGANFIFQIWQGKKKVESSLTTPF